MDREKRLWLKVGMEQGWLKAVDLDARPIHGVAHGVEQQIGP